MPNSDRSFNSFRTAGTNGRLDFSLSKKNLVNQLVNRVKYGLGPGCPLLAKENVARKSPQNEK